MGTKEDIILIAKTLFFTKGYNKTSIQNIIDRAEIAKGTFYHHFKSKEDLLNQFVQQEVSELYEITKKIVEQNISAIEKFEAIFNSSSNWKSENMSQMKSLLKILISNENLYLRTAMLEYEKQQLTPVYTKILQQGVDEGSFNIQDTEYTSLLIINLFSGFTDQVYSYLSEPKYSQEIINKFKKLMRNFEDTLDRILGMKKGSIHIIDDLVLEDLIKGFLED